MTITQVGVKSCAYYGYSGHPTTVHFNIYDFTLTLVATADISAGNTCGSPGQNLATLSTPVSLVDSPVLYIAATFTRDPGWNSQFLTNVNTSHTIYGAGTGSPHFGIVLYGVSPPQDLIDINYPANGATSTSPTIFQINYTTALNFSTSSLLHYEIDVNLGATTSTMTLAGLAGAGSNYSLTPLYVNLTNDHPLNQNYTYFEQARLIYFPLGLGNGEGVLVASSTIKSFTTGAGYAGNPSYYDIPTSTATSSAWTFTCDPDSGFFGYSICSMFKWLFVPAPDVLTQFTDLKSRVATKPPMGYFNIVIADIQGLNASGTPAFVLMPAALVSSMSGFFFLVDEAIGIAIVLLGLMWAYHRARNLKL